MNSTMSEITLLDRSKPPIPGPLPTVNFPKFREEELSNGLRVFLVENHEQPLVNVSLYVRAGSMHDPALKEGLAAVTTDLITKGTARRNAEQIAEEIDFIGGSLSSNASWDSMTLSTGVLSKFLDKALDLLADVALNPTFPQDELERVRLQRLAALKQAKADAGFLADSQFSRLVFPNHPYGQQASGTETSIAQIGTEDIRKFYNAAFGPNYSFLIAAGDVEPKAFLAQLETLFGAWKPSRGLAMPLFHEVESKAVSVALVEKPAAVQSAIRVGHTGIARSNADYVVLHVLNMLFGGYFNSRVNMNLREKHGYTYGARSYFDARLYPGPFVVSTEVSTSVTSQSVAEILFELRRITDETISEEELTLVKNYVIGSFPLQLETPQQVASRVATIVAYDLPRDYYDTFRAKVAAITSDDLLAAARKYLHPDHVTIVASGDLSVLKSTMAGFGAMVVYDTDGKPII
jgi:predicted Zn-dependent peptidase